MFRYLLAFLLINSCYQSFGIPTQKNHLISSSLAELDKHCENIFLSKAINSKIKECNVFAPPYLEKQIRCLIFYDINKQLCEAVAAVKIALSEDYTAKIMAEQDITTVCKSAQDWVFSNITEYEPYKNISENFFKNLVTCGEMCGVQNNISAVNDYCKYYKWGIDMLKSQVITTSDNVNNVAVLAPVKQETDSNIKSEKVSVKSVQSQPEIAEVSKPKTLDMPSKQTESAVLNSTPIKSGDSSDIEVQKSTALTTSTKQTLRQESEPTGDKHVEANGNNLEHPILLEANINEQANKSIVANGVKQTGEENDPAPLPESGRDAPALDAKGIDQVDGKVASDDEYTDSEGNDGVDDDGDDQGMEIKSEKKPEPVLNNKVIVSHDTDISQKELYPNTISDSYTDDSDHFFPFFLTAVILVVLLYVLYHNKSKVSKVFFGLILEGRQGGRRRNSRGHAYRRLDTLEQAMSANTAAPPSKIIY